MAVSGGPGNLKSSDELSQQEKRDLWSRYGQYFSSKEQAKQTYDEYYKRQKEGRASDPAP
jgi:hypothetical protein